MGEGRLVRERAQGMRREQAQLVRLLLVCAAWAAGRTLLFGLPTLGWLHGLGFDLVIPAGLAVGVYALTDDLGRGNIGGRGGGGGPPKYWRGQRIDDKPRDRWN